MTWQPVNTPLGLRWLPSETDRRLLAITRQKMTDAARTKPPKP